MKSVRPTTIEEYIRSAPVQGQPHLRTVYAILKSVAPKAQEVIKWGNPFFIEPRFVFAFSAYKAHLSFSPGQKAMQAFRVELESHETTANFLRIPYADPVPEKLVRKLALYSLKTVSERKGDSFW